MNVNCGCAVLSFFLYQSDFDLLSSLFNVVISKSDKGIDNEHFVLCLFVFFHRNKGHVLGIRPFANLQSVCQSNRSIFTSAKNVILSFLRQYSLFLDNFFSDERLFSELHFDPKSTF